MPSLSLFPTTRWSWTENTECTQLSRRSQGRSTSTLAACFWGKSWRRGVTSSSLQPLTLVNKESSCSESSLMCLQTASKLVFQKKNQINLHCIVLFNPLPYSCCFSFHVQFQLKYVIHRGHVPGSVILLLFIFCYS